MGGISDSSLRKPIPTKGTIETFDEALAAIELIAESNTDRRVLFRGHADSSWRMCPGLFRQKPDISQFEHEMVRELISAFPAHFTDDLSMFDKLVRMQHFGLPTRLLDVTKNPLVALYFACDPEYEDTLDGSLVFFIGARDRHKFFDSDVVSCMANLANLKLEEKKSIEDTPLTTVNELRTLNAVDRLAQFIRVEKPYFKDRIKKLDLFRPVSVTPKMSNPRLNAQFGEFVLYGLDAEKGPSFPRSSGASKYDIASSSKPKIRKKLENLGITGAFLFPEIDKAAKQIRRKYCEMT
jgi:hypothetical protein